jgi:outer membrane protein OmpA-like peptidoglycan-associated protein
MKKILLLILITISTNLYAQNYLGVSSSNYAGVMGTDIQPASFVDGRFMFDLNLGSVNFLAFQNFGSFDASVLPNWWKGSFADQETVDSWVGEADPNLESDYFGGYGFLPKLYDQNSSSVLGFNTNLQVDILNFMFHVHPKVAVGFSAKARSITNVDNIDPKLAYLAEVELEDQDFWDIQLNEELINLNHMTWTEYAFKYAQIIKEEGQHFLKAGANLKYLSGYAAAYLYSNNFQYNLFNDDTTQYLGGDFGYGYSESIHDAATNESIDNGGMFGLPKASARGFGLDLGVVYEWRPDYKDYKYDMDGEMNLWARDRNKYKVRVGLSLTDLGGMKFKKGGISRDFSVQTSNLFDINTFGEAGDLEEFDATIDSLITQSTNDGNTDWTSGERDTASTFYMRTPKAFSFQVDYHIWKSFYVNATGIFNIISKNRDSKVKIANQFSITPSFDYAWFGIHLPLSINDYSGFKAGLGARLGPLTIGITDFRFLFASGNVRGTELYAGVRVPILYGSPNDLDGDKVSDKVDDCIDVPGPWSFKGCPDTDNDGIVDMKDDCPLDSGLVEFQGCPDRDHDSIPDRVDDCPDTPGLAEYNGCPDTDLDGIIDRDDDCPLDSGLVVFNGCPDTDLDGVMDKEDDCPLDSGLVVFNGCPDTDGDGISDQDDACPLIYGEKEFQGCPDTDKDGIIDGIDDCIETPGPKENNGCPWPDTDEDGLLDKDDDCPTIPGPKDNNGCPFTDTDEDGTLDKDDECPNTPGPIENKGCPILEQKIVEVLKTAFDNLEFRTSKDIILSDSKPSLEELSEVLTERPEWTLEISGHTDNVGNADKNMVLSKKRAESVMRFLISKGVSESQLVIKFFGETTPIADNNTAEGRQKNRRVEMKITFE